MIECLGTGQQLGVGDTLGEFVPGDDRLNGGEGIVTRRFGVQQGLTYFRVQAHLVVDRLALFLKLLLMLFLGAAEQLDQNAVVQIYQGSPQNTEFFVR